MSDGVSHKVPRRKGNDLGCKSNETWSQPDSRVCRYVNMRMRYCSLIPSGFIISPFGCSRSLPVKDLIYPTFAFVSRYYLVFPAGIHLMMPVRHVPRPCLISLAAFAVVWPKLITAQIPGCLDVTSLLVLRSFFSSPSYFGILVFVIDFLGFVEGYSES
jgi:hypothetical protein